MYNQNMIFPIPRKENKDLKYVVVLADGMADYPIPELGHKTPLACARTPNLDFLASKGIMGMVKTIPDGMPPGSDVANLSVMGYDPARYYTGRSPLEAMAMGVELEPGDVAFRCNLVTLSEEGDFPQKTMVDYSSDEITSTESAQLIAAVKERFDSEDIRFYPGVSYRHLMVWKNGPLDLELTPPHDISDRVIAEHLPRGEGSELLLSLMQESNRFLPSHPVNLARVQRGLRPATSLWFWGHGTKPALPLFADKYGLRGSVIAAVDLTKGIGVCAGLRMVNVPGATGNIHTDFRGKARAALKELEDGQDFVYIHVEAPDEAGHRGELETKIKAIEEIDEKVIGELLSGLERLGRYRLMVLPDHPTPLAVRTHTAEEVPFVIFDSAKQHKSERSAYDEASARSTGLRVEKGYELMDWFIRG